MCNDWIEALQTDHETIKYILKEWTVHERVTQEQLSARK